MTHRCIISHEVASQTSKVELFRCAEGEHVKITGLRSGPNGLEVIVEVLPGEGQRAVELFNTQIEPLS